MINNNILKPLLLISAILNIAFFVVPPHGIADAISLIIGSACVIAYESL